MNEQVRAYISLHLCVLIWGFTAILGKLISLSALPLVAWRVLICCVLLLCIVPLRLLQQLPKAQIVRLIGIGVVVGLHWICFYAAIKIANASIALASISTMAFFSALIEPWVTKRRFNWYELGLGFLILPGMLLIVGDLDWTMRKGLLVGILCAFLAAFFTVLNKREIERHQPSPIAMSFFELFGALGVLLLILAFNWPQADQLWPNTQDWLWLFLLSAVCTILPYYLVLKAMQHVSAFATNLINNMEPVYGILLAWLFFREDKDLNPGFYVGVAIVLLAIFTQPFLKARFEKK